MLITDIKKFLLTLIWLNQNFRTTSDAIKHLRTFYKTRLKNLAQDAQRPLKCAGTNDRGKINIDAMMRYNANYSDYVSEHECKNKRETAIGSFSQALVYATQSHINRKAKHAIGVKRWTTGSRGMNMMTNVSIASLLTHAGMLTHTLNIASMDARKRTG